jgi:transcriptional regulator with XRE-family HTH domain
MYLNLGKRIYEYRKTMGMTQEELSHKLGVTPQAVSKWENEVSCPDIMLLPDLADIFDISIDELFKHEKRKKYEQEHELIKLGSRY